MLYCHCVMHATEPLGQVILSKNATGINLVNIKPSTCLSNIHSVLNIMTSNSMIAIDIEVSANRTYWIDQRKKVLVCLDDCNLVYKHLLLHYCR